MACIWTNALRLVLGQVSCRANTLSRHILPANSYLLKVNGCQTTEYQQCRTKKTYIEYKFNKPLKFDNSGDLMQQDPIPKNTILFKYQDLPELETLPEELKKLFTVEYATARELIEHRHMVIQDKMLQTLGPDQCLEKQIAYLTVKIRNLIEKHPRVRANKVEKVHLLERIAKRNKFLGYLRHLDFERYEWIQKELSIRYIPHDKYKFHRPGRRAARKKETREAMIDEIHLKYKQCKNQFNKELADLQKQKEEIVEDIKNHDLDGKVIADQLLKDLQAKKEGKITKKLSPKFREFEEERRRKKLEDSYVF